MELKKYQQEVLDDIKEYVDELSPSRSLEESYRLFWQKKGIDITTSQFSALHEYQDTIKGVPRVTLKVPTAGGKTFIACNAIPYLISRLQKNSNKVVAWFVPSDTILEQTYNNLRNPSHPYRQKLDSLLGNNVVVINKEDALLGKSMSPVEISGQTTILVLSVQSFAANKKELRKVYQENENLSESSAYNSSNTNVTVEAADTALIKVLSALRPLVIIDESHNFQAQLRVEMLNSLNPCFVLELTATPRENSNIISFVDAIKLKKENMVKLPVIVYNQQSTSNVILSAINLQKSLEAKAKKAEENGSRYIRPIVLFQAQPKNDKDNITFEKIKDKLIECGIDKEQIKIKTAALNEIEGVDLLSHDCNIRYIITVNALKEGWDCPFAYILASLANRTSDVDVEQILGRILRLPYTEKQPDDLLNISYVFTSSSDFRGTIEKIITSLNNAGFSKKDYRCSSAELEEENSAEIEEKTEESSLFGENGEQESDNIEDTIDTDYIRTSVQGNKDSDVNSTTEIEAFAKEKSDEYNTEISESGNESDYPTDLSKDMTHIKIQDNYLADAKNIRIPYLCRKVEYDGSIFQESQYQRISKESLEQGFSEKLLSFDSNIDYTMTSKDIVKVDLSPEGKTDYNVKKSSLDSRQNSLLRKAIENKPLDSQKRNFVSIVTRLLNFNSIPEKTLSDYIAKSLDGVKQEDLSELMTNPIFAAKCVRDQLEKLLYVYRKDLFKKWIDKNIIFAPQENAYTFPENDNVTKKMIGIRKGLYTEEENVNNFEYDVISSIADVDNVKFWHRNKDTTGFEICGFIDHFPDFIVQTNSGKTILVETKGEHLANDDSKDKLELGKEWASLAGPDYKYFMVFDKKTSVDGITTRELIDILKNL